MIVRTLQKIQKKYDYLPAEVLTSYAARAGIRIARVQEVASFFPHFRFAPPPQTRIQVCRDMTCRLKGSARVLEAAQRIFQHGNEVVELEQVSCLGRCDDAPVVAISRHESPSNHSYHVCRVPGASQEELVKNVRSIANGTMVAPDRDSATPPNWAIDVYHSADAAGSLQPYEALRHFLRAPDPEKFLKQLESGQLLGMGGALGRAAKKWQEVKQAEAGLKYVVCNGDESEPGTFKDREILLHAPHLVVEGMILAAHVLSATKGFVYVRHEYQEQIHSVERAIREARRAVPQAFHAFDLEVFESPGRYVCGEESALLEVLEGRRAQPRCTPPEIQTNGLFNKPTLVNNVETFAWVPAIHLMGGDWFRERRLRFFSISGDVSKPGVFEISMDKTIGDLIQLAGGLRGDLRLKAIAASGPSGGFLPAEIDTGALRERIGQQLNDMRGKRPEQEVQRLEKFSEKLSQSRISLMEFPLDGTLLRNLGMMLGAGIIVYGEAEGRHTDMLEHASSCSEFFARESCGKCAPCRLGCQSLVQLSAKARDAGEAQSVKEITDDLAEAMRLTSICGLGRTAATPLLTYLEHFGRNGQ